MKPNWKSAIGGSILADRHTNNRTSDQITAIETQLEVPHRSVVTNERHNSGTHDQFTAIETQLELTHRSVDASR